DRARAGRGGSATARARAPGHRSRNALDQKLADVPDRLRGIEPLRTDFRAVHDGMAAEQLVRIFQVVQALAGRLVARVGDESVRPQERRRAHELVRVPPERRALRRAAAAENAFVKAVQLVAILGRLQPLALRYRIVV